MAPVVSFIIPVRNDADRLRQCLASISAPPDLEIEIVVADNGSQDSSPDVARAAGARVLSLPDRPVSQVRNEAARAARGEFLARRGPYPGSGLDTAGPLSHGRSRRLGRRR